MVNAKREIGRSNEQSVAPLRRVEWASVSDSQLLGQCEVDTYRASGPGGQKRNKTSSAVRLRHVPSGVIVIAEESRSQHENRGRALRRLRQAIYLQVRENLRPEDLRAEALAARPDYCDARSPAGRLNLGRKDPRFWPVAALVLDVLQAVEARVSAAAEALGTSTGNLIDFLKVDVKVWQQANRLRSRFGQKPLLH
jgi:hypothetical protein